MVAGGYQKPSNPAPVSGPGAMSQRTDGGPTQAAMYMSGLPRGEGQAQMQQQTSAPMAGNPTALAQVSTASMAPAPQMPPTIGIFEPTNNPDEPVTAGMDFGPGPDSSVLGMPNLPKDDDPAIRAIQALYMQNPRNEDLRLIIQTLNDEGRIS
jgi:hypothetical protein